MIAIRTARLIPALGVLLGLVGCNTDEDLAQQRLNMLKAEADSLTAMKQDLEASGSASFEGPNAVSIFLSGKLINSALGVLKGLTLPVPSRPTATITINAVVADMKLGYPLVNVDAQATDKNLGLTLQVTGTARLETKIDPGAPSQMTINVRLEDLVPHAKWGIFDFGVRGFVKDLIQARVAKELNTLAVFQVPIATDIPISLPANAMPVSFRGAKAVVNTPAMSILGRATISRILVLPDGLHVFGTVTAKVGS